MVAEDLAQADRIGGSRPIGLQLFTVMSLLEQDFEATLQRVAAIGYKEVETVGSFGRDPAYVRAVLDRTGLRSRSAHLMPGDLYQSFAGYVAGHTTKDVVFAQFSAAFATDRVEEFIDEAIGRGRIMGQDTIVWQLAWPEPAVLADVDRYARAFNRAGRLCKDAGLQFAVHNHDNEFIKIGDDIPYDLMLQQTDPALVKLQVDFYWMLKGNGDPFDYLTRFEGRYTSCHLKDRDSRGDITTLGAGIEDLPALLRLAQYSGIEQYIVEYDKPIDPITEITASYQFLAALAA